MSETIIIKRCPKCKESKPISEFNKDLAKKDGLRFCCRICDCKQRKQYRLSERGKATEKLYQQSKRGKAAQKCYDQSERGRARHIRYAKRYEATHPERIKAKTAVCHAVAKGILPKVDTLICSCGKTGKHYHHHKGYDKKHWLDVVPACTQCHNKITPLKKPLSGLT